MNREEELIESIQVSRLRHAVLIGDKFLKVILRQGELKILGADLRMVYCETRSVSC